MAKSNRAAVDIQSNKMETQIGMEITGQTVLHIYGTGYSPTER
jgi:hypothetical protein